MRLLLALLLLALLSLVGCVMGIPDAGPAPPRPPEPCEVVVSEVPTGKRLCISRERAGHILRDAGVAW